MQLHNQTRTYLNLHPVVREARSWIGTPYQHQASLKGVGADCLGLVRGVYRAFYGPEPEPTPPYSPYWAEYHGHDHLSLMARKYFVEVAKEEREAGDIVLFQWRKNAIPKHLAILSTKQTMIHAHQGSKVCEVELTRWWEVRIKGVYRFPKMKSSTV